MNVIVVVAAAPLFDRSIAKTRFMIPARGVNFHDELLIQTGSQDPQKIIELAREKAGEFVAPEAVSRLRLIRVRNNLSAVVGLYDPLKASESSWLPAKPREFVSVSDLANQNEKLARTLATVFSNYLRLQLPS